MPRRSWRETEGRTDGLDATEKQVTIFSFERLRGFHGQFTKGSHVCN